MAATYDAVKIVTDIALRHLKCVCEDDDETRVLVAMLVEMNGAMQQMKSESVRETFRRLLEEAQSRLASASE